MKLKSIIINYDDDGTVTLSACGVVYYKGTPMLISVNELRADSDSQRERLMALGNKTGSILEEMLLESNIKEE